MVTEEELNKIGGSLADTIDKTITQPRLKAEIRHVVTIKILADLIQAHMGGQPYVDQLAAELGAFFGQNAQLADADDTAQDMLRQISAEVQKRAQV